MARLTVNGKSHQVAAAPETPLLWVLRDHLGLSGTKYGCAAGACGACTIHVDGVATLACVTPLEAVAGSEIVTIEGLSPTGDHKLQRAWVAEQVPQCGYCQPGQIMRAAALLAENPQPDRDEIAAYMAPNLCRCGTYNRIARAIARAAEEA